MLERGEHHTSQEELLPYSSSSVSPHSGSSSIASSLDELAKGLANMHRLEGQGYKVGGALLGAALASFLGVAWADGCRRLGRECRRDSQCCSRNCVRRGDDKVCGGPAGQTRCNDRCVNLKTNERHCGRCFNRCPEGQECVDGVCRGGCPNERICGDSCCPAGERCTFLSNNETICCSAPNCQGAVSAAGPGVCFDFLGTGGHICNRPTCNTDADCSGEVCIQTPGCGGNRCVPAC
jgi:hypothetical protein